MRKMIYFILFSMLLGIVLTRSDWVSPPSSGGGAADGNNYPNSLTVSGSSLKTITIGREGMSDLTADFTDATSAGGVWSLNQTLNTTDNAQFNMLNVSVATARSLNAASCDVKANTNGTLYCGTDATGSGSGAPIDAPYMLGESLNYLTVTNAIRIPEDAVFWEEMNYPVASYNRITTAPTVNTGEVGKPSCINFPSATTSGGDGGYIATGATATNVALYNVTQLRYMKTGVKLNAVGARSDIIGMFRSATTVVQNSSLTGIFFYFNSSVGTTWWAVEAHNGAMTIINTTFAGDTNWHNLTINSSGTKFQMWFDSILVTTFNQSDTNFPKQLVSSIGSWVENRETNADTLVINYFYYRMKRGY